MLMSTSLCLGTFRNHNNFTTPTLSTAINWNGAHRDQQIPRGGRLGWLQLLPNRALPSSPIKSSIADVAPFPEKSTTSRAALPVTFAFVPSGNNLRASARNAVLWEPVRLVLVCVFLFVDVVEKMKGG